MILGGAMILNEEGAKQRFLEDYKLNLRRQNKDFRGTKRVF